MKKKICIICVILVVMAAVFSGCTDQYTTKKFGGSMTLELEPNQKLEEITWKDDSLWYLTRPMRDDEKAETHVFQQSSEFGVFEGNVTVIEKKE